MTSNVVVRPSGRSFSTDEGETLLDAGLRQGVTLPYGCRDGACGACKAKLLCGEVTMTGSWQPRALSETEAAEGQVLMCRAHASGEVEIECRGVVAEGVIAPRKFPARVASLARPSDDVVVLRLQLPASERAQFNAGQFLDIILRDGTRRSYSIANAPHLAEQVELHIRHVPGGRFTDTLFGKAEPALKERDILRIEMPLGTFFLRQSNRPALLLATGTGFGPIKAMVEHAIHTADPRELRLYWGGRTLKDLYAHDTALELERQAKEAGVDFTYVPVLSRPAPEDNWTGRTGHVQDVALADESDYSVWQAYACGSPAMVDSARRALVERGDLLEDNYFADAFTTAADNAVPHA
ncbi:CDP-6-deoxy-delta-3,4-glucoseen reductase [Derxia gummosa]|uniref:CDP-6-deoxy-delta-3,4-glucoseen reductase n=1 Tax=Derxia gummosa DSM 723 TaxID=1121388 RepID=A0A8B6X1G7_9BURK|nr:CDP-6-deoxy-delta-3,4-glucoseen reductase [Derxia gummosa]